MGFLVLAAILGFLLLGGGSAVSAWLLPGLPPPLGAGLLLAGVVTTALLALPPTRFLAQAFLVGMAKCVLILASVSLQVLRTIGRTVWTSSRTAWHALRREPR
jgi:hypothetical protein